MIVFGMMHPVAPPRPDASAEEFEAYEHRMKSQDSAQFWIGVTFISSYALAFLYGLYVVIRVTL